MEIQFSQEELDKYAKQSKKIMYSTDVLRRENNIQLIRKELKRGINAESLWAIILKYEIKKGINQEVILGTMGMTSDRRRKISDIEKFIGKQLEQNVDKNSEYTYYEQLEKYIEKENIPFELSMEGRDIISCKSEEPMEFYRTIFEDEQGQLMMLYTEKEIEEMKANEHNILDGYAQKKEEEEHWKITREKILKNITLDEKEKFILGEKIAEVVQRTEMEEFDNKKTSDIKGRFKRKVAAKYLLEVFDDEHGYDDIQSAKILLLDFYKNMKEKGLASDVISTLEVLEKKIFDRSQKQKGQINEKDLNDIQELQRYIQFFNIVKKGMDWNARLYALKIGKIDFDKLNKIVERFNGQDSELLEYLKVKEEMINETQAEDIRLDESKYPSVRKLYKFILNSEAREDVRNDEEYLIEKVFEQYKSELIRDNKEALQVYNHYAKIHGRFVCPTTMDGPEYSDMDVLGEDENEGSR